MDKAHYIQDSPSIAGFPVIESAFVQPGQAIIVEGRTILHPLDLLRISRPDLGPVERVMVLVDRVYNKSLARLGDQ